MAARPTEVLRPKSLAEALQLLELESVPGKSEEVEAAFRKRALDLFLVQAFDHRGIQKFGSVVCLQTPWLPDRPKFCDPRALQKLFSFWSWSPSPARARRSKQRSGSGL